MAVFSVNNSNDRFTLQLTVTEVTQSIANNSTDLSYVLKLIANTSYNFSTYAIGRTVKINGTTVYDVSKANSGKFDIAKYGTITLASGNTTVKHNADGTKTDMAVAFSIDMTSVSYTPGSLSGSGKMNLTAIPRQANIISAPDFTDEQNPTIEYLNPAGNSVTSLQACISFDGWNDDIAYRDISKTGTSYTFPLTDAERQILQNGTTGNTRTVRFYVRTELGGTKYLSWVEKTLTIVNANPTFIADQVTYRDANDTTTALTKNDQNIVQKKSTVYVKYTPAIANKGATISRYDFEINGVKKTKTNNGDEFNFGAVDSANDVLLTATVTDSRGNTTTVEKTIKMLAWSTPVFTVSLERLNNYEDETYLKVNASISSVDNKNTMNISYAYKENGGSYGSAVSISNDTKYTLNCDKNKAYVFGVTVADAFESVTDEYALSKGKFPLFIDTEKNAVGINDFPIEGEALRVAEGVGRFNDGIVLCGSTKNFLITVTDSGILSITEYEGE